MICLFSQIIRFSSWIFTIDRASSAAAYCLPAFHFVRFPAGTASAYGRKKMPHSMTPSM